MARSCFKHPPDLPTARTDRPRSWYEHATRPGADAPTVTGINSTEDQAHLTGVLTMLDLVALLRAQGDVGQPRSRHVPCFLSRSLMTRDRESYEFLIVLLRQARERDLLEAHRRTTTWGNAPSRPPSSVGRAHPW
jgi:hypothetical protein